MIPIPTGLLMKAGTGALLAALLIFGGCRWQKGIDAEKLADKEKALQASETSLRAAASALRAQNTENAKRIADAEEFAANVAQAELAADAEQKRQAELLAKASRDFESRLLIAQRRAACKAWLDTNVRETCGL